MKEARSLTHRKGICPTSGWVKPLRLGLLDLSSLMLTKWRDNALPALLLPNHLKVVRSNYVSSPGTSWFTCLCHLDPDDGIGRFY